MIEIITWYVESLTAFWRGPMGGGLLRVVILGAFIWWLCHRRRCCCCCCGRCRCDDAGEEWEVEEIEVEAIEEEDAGAGEETWTEES